MYFRKKIISQNFITAKNRHRVLRLFDADIDIESELIHEWQIKWDNSSKGRQLYNFFPSIESRLKKHWLYVDHCTSQFLTGHGNFKAKLHSMNLVASPFCECSTPGCRTEQTAHHILWECPRWADDRDSMIKSLKISSGVVYYPDLVDCQNNFRAFKRFCHKYYWNAGSIPSAMPPPP